MPEGRLRELVLRAQATGRAQFTPFLTPPEAQLAQVVAKREGCSCELFGGYEDAERQVACFCQDEPPKEDFPIQAVRLGWPRQKAPGHRDILGSVLALGLERHCLGDIVLMEDRAYLFALPAVATHIAEGLQSAGRVHLQAELAEELPPMEAAGGAERRVTVHSLRLDAVLASGLNLSRGKAAELVEGGQVKLRHSQTLRPDARVAAGDVISVQGMGRLQLDEVGTANRKGRYPIRLQCFGLRH